MQKIVMEMDVHVTKVIEIPDDFPEQISYKALEAMKTDPDADKKKIHKLSLYAVGATLTPLIKGYDKFDIKDSKMFIKEEEPKDDKLDGESESEGTVSEPDVETESGTDE